MSQEVALQLIALGGTFIASLTTVALAFIAMRRAGQAQAKATEAAEIGAQTHALLQGRLP